MNSDPTCGDCIHCLPGPNTEQDVLSRCCYRYPPLGTVVQANGGMAVLSYRPEIRTSTIACGEFETAEDDEPSANKKFDSSAMQS